MADRSIAGLQFLHPLVQLIDANDEAGDGVQEPVEDERGGDEEGVALRLHDGLLVAEVFGGATGCGFAGGSGLVLPVDVHQEEEAEGHHRQEWLEEAPGHADQAPPERFQTRDREEEEHDRLCSGGVA